MKVKTKIEVSIDQVMELVKNLNPSEKEAFRDELLSWLLFSGTEESQESFKGLSKQEQELLRKLASQSDALYRAMNNPQQNDSTNNL